MNPPIKISASALPIDQPGFWPRGVEWAYLIGAWIALALPTLIYPFARDQGLFAFIGLKMLDGAALYRELWEVKSPLIYAIYGLGLKITGGGEVGFRIFDASIIFLCATLTYSLTRRLGQFGSRHASVLAAVIFLCVYYLPNDYRVLANCEVYIVPFMLAGLISLVSVGAVRDRGAASWWAGVFFGLTLLVKTSAIVFIAPALFGILCAESASWNARSRLRDVALFGCGFALPLGLCALYLYYNDAVRDWAYINFVYLPYYTNLAHESGLYPALVGAFYFCKSILINYPALALGAFFFTFLVVRKRSLSGAGRAITIIALFAGIYVVAVVIQGKYLVYQFIPFFPTLAILCAVLATTLLEDLRTGAIIRIVALAALVVSFLPLWRHVERYRDLARYATNPQFKYEYFAKISQGNYSCATVRKVGDFLRASVLSAGGASGDISGKARDRMFMWTFSPELYYITDLDNASRFLFNSVFYAGELSNSYKAELMRDLRRDPPRFFVTAENDALPLISGAKYSSRQSMSTAPGLQSFVNERYQEVAHIDNFYILERRATPLAIPGSFSDTLAAVAQ